MPRECGGRRAQKEKKMERLMGRGKEEEVYAGAPFWEISSQQTSQPARIEVEIPFYKEEVQLIKAKVGCSEKGATLI